MKKERRKIINLRKFKGKKDLKKAEDLLTLPS